MSRKHDEPVVSRHLELYESDWEFIQQQVGRKSETKLGASVVIRQLVRKGVRDYRERIARRLDRLRGSEAPTAMPALDKFFKEEEVK